MGKPKLPIRLTHNGAVSGDTLSPPCQYKKRDETIKFLCVVLLSSEVFCVGSLLESSPYKNNINNLI